MQFKGAVVLLALVCLVPLQGQERDARQRQDQVTGTMMPVSRLPQIGLPLPPTGLPRPADSQADDANHEADSRGRTARHAGRRTRAVVPPTVIYLGPVYPWDASVTTTARQSETGAGAVKPAPLVQPPAPTGRVWLDLDAPPSTQVLVDGYYVGTLDTVGRVLDVEPGPHQIRLRADGFHPLVVDVRVVAEQFLTYREMLKPVDADTDGARGRTSVAPPRAPATLYVIPGCYAGNLPPEELTLPQGCDRALMTTLTR